MKQMSMEEVRRIEQKDGFEFCKSCFEKTNIPINTPINNRRHYIEGVGQLCPSCHEIAYEKAVYN